MTLFYSCAIVRDIMKKPLKIIFVSLVAVFAIFGLVATYAPPYLSWYLNEYQETSSVQAVVNASTPDAEDASFDCQHDDQGHQVGRVGCGGRIQN